MDQELITLRVSKSASEGEGVSELNDKKVYIPYSLDGELVTGTPYFRRGKQQAFRIEKVLESSEQRGEAFCPKFTLCGGCQLQHLKLSSYKSFKEGLLNQALSDHNIDYKAKFTYWAGTAQRRRVSLSYEKRHERLLLGFYRHRSHHIEDIDNCSLLTDKLNDLIAPLRRFLTNFCQNRESGFVHLTQTDTGIDLSWSPARFKSRDLTLDKVQSWCQFAQENKISRITRAAKDLIVEHNKPALNWSGHTVTFPSASFLQPSKQSEQYMVTKALEWLENLPFKPKAYYDLFCGLGTFSFPFLSSINKPLFSYDCDGPAISILKDVSKRHPKWTVGQRDLFQEPLEDFEENSVIILDPPRQGAREQIKALGTLEQKVALVIISCDPQSLARDLSELLNSGFSLKQCIGIDQFPWTNHVESMAYLEKNT